MRAKEELLELERQWANAIQHKDGATLERLLAAEYALASRMGLMQRDEWLAAARDYNVEEFRFESSDVRLYGNVALVTLWYWQRADLRGQDLTGTFLITDLWMRGVEGWKVVSRHSTFAEPETS